MIMVLDKYLQNQYIPNLVIYINTYVGLIQSVIHYKGSVLVTMN